MKKLFLLPIVLLSTQAIFAVGPDNPNVIANQNMIQRRQEFTNIIIALATCCNAMVQGVVNNLFNK